LSEDLKGGDHLQNRGIEENIKMDLTEIGCEGVNLSQLAQDRVQWWATVNSVVKLRVP
jgi:hypothetical protein